MLEIGQERSRIEQPTRSPATRERKSAMGLDAFDTSLQKVNEWLKELAKELKWTDREKAFFALQAVLGTLRDRLATSEAFKVSAQLPMILRGFYFEGWDTNQVPSRERTREDFLKRVAEKLPKDLKASAADATRAVFALLSHRMTRGEVVHVRTQLPQKVRKLWPEEEPLLPVESPRKARRASTGRGVQIPMTAPRSRARKARQEIRSAIARARAAGVTNQDLPVLISRKNLPSEASRRNRPHA